MTPSSNLVADVRPFSKDRLHLVNRDEVAKVVHKALNHIQHYPPEVQVAAAGMLFAAWCSRLRLDPQDLHTQSLRMLQPQEFRHKGNIWVEVLRDFAGMRLAGDPSVDIR